VGLSILHRPTHLIATLRGDIAIAPVPVLRERPLGMLLAGMRLLNLDLSWVRRPTTRPRIGIHTGVDQAGAAGPMQVGVGSPFPSLKEEVAATSEVRREGAAHDAWKAKVIVVTLPRSSSPHRCCRLLRLGQLPERR
jgi:hypothetical protein